MKTVVKNRSSLESIIGKAQEFITAQGLKIELAYQVDDSVLEVISQRSKEASSMYFVSVEMLQKRLENGCFLLFKDKELIGHIFAHKHQVNKYAVYERSSLWISPEYRSYNLGLFLMRQLTELYANDFLISIARKPTVHYYNELLGMSCITLSEMSTMLVEALEKIGKLRDELQYKYYVNPCFDSKIRQL